MSNLKVVAKPMGVKWHFNVLICNSLFTSERDRSILSVYWPFAFLLLLLCLLFLLLLHWPFVYLTAHVLFISYYV